MNQGENAPPMHARCRCTIVAYDGLQYGTRATRGDNGSYQRVPADMSYRDWKAVYIDKSKTFETWRTEFDARSKADENSALRQRGRQVIDDLATGRLPTAASGAKVATRGLAAGNIDLTTTQGTPPKLIGKLENVTATAIQKTLEYYEAQIVTAPVEHAIIITKAGEIWHISGDVHGMSFEHFARLSRELEGAHVTHNHPVGAEENDHTFSNDDFERFSSFKMARLRGVDDRFTYELNQNPKDNELYGHDLDELYSMGFNFDDYHVAIMIKALAGGFGYKRWLR